MHADFNSQSPQTYTPWLAPNFDVDPSKGSQCDTHPHLFTPSAHGHDCSVSPPNAHYVPQEQPFRHSPHHGNQPIVYPESSQRTLMDDTGPYRPMYDTPSRQTSPPARAAVLSRSFASLPPRYTAMRETYPNMHPLNTSDTSLASHHYRVPNPSSQSSPQDPSPTHHSMNNMYTEFTLSLLPGRTPISSPTSPISLFPNKPDLRPTMLTLQVNSLDVVDDPDNHTTLSSLIESRMEISGHKYEQIFSPTVPSLSPMNETRSQRAPYARDNMFNGANPARSDSSLSNSSTSTQESDFPPVQYSSFPNGEGARGRTSISKSASPPGRTSRKNKMHPCNICGKQFPRPSGLGTHMNSHNGKKPYKCLVPGCPKAFAVRSNAKRHLRTHGVSAVPLTTPQMVNTTFTVGFDPPFVSSTFDGGAIPKLKWVEQGPATRTAIDWPDSPSGSDEADGGASPISAVQPSTRRDGFDVAQGYVGAPHQYHPSQKGTSTD
jgi:hypothetical protein